jgi:hypothetical protein
MVAYTTDFCLPYLEGSDTLCLNTGTVCDPSSVWCDLAALVEAQLDALDAVVARTGDAIPLARVSYRPDDPTLVGSQVIFPFDTVDVDTDNMVDLTTYPGVVPNRNGVYSILAEVALLTTGQVAAEESEMFFIQAGPETPITPLSSPGVGIGFQTQRTIAVARNTYSGSALWNVTDTSPIPRTITLFSRFNLNPVISASLTVFWHSEAV